MRGGLDRTQVVFSSPSGQLRASCGEVMVQSSRSSAGACSAANVVIVVETWKVIRSTPKCGGGGADGGFLQVHFTGGSGEPEPGPDPPKHHLPVQPKGAEVPGPGPGLGRFIRQPLSLIDGMSPNFEIYTVQFSDSNKSTRIRACCGASMYWLKPSDLSRVRAAGYSFVAVTTRTL